MFAADSLSGRCFDGFFGGSPVCNHHLRNASFSSHYHYPPGFLVSWWPNAYIDGTEVEMASNWFFLLCSPHLLWVLCPGKHWNHSQSQCSFFFTSQCLLLTRFLRKEWESSTLCLSLPVQRWRTEDLLWGHGMWDLRHQKSPSRNPLFNFQSSFPLYPWVSEVFQESHSFQIHTWKFYINSDISSGIPNKHFSFPGASDEMPALASCNREWVLNICHCLYSRLPFNQPR